MKAPLALRGALFCGRSAFGGAAGVAWGFCESAKMQRTLLRKCNTGKLKVVGRKRTFVW